VWQYTTNDKIIANTAASASASAAAAAAAVDVVNVVQNDGDLNCEPYHVSVMVI